MSHLSFAQPSEFGLTLDPFWPATLQGLNVGGGGGSTQEIRIRLRPAGREAEFLPYESILGTILHEVTHNVIG